MLLSSFNNNKPISALHADLVSGQEWVLNQIGQHQSLTPPTPTHLRLHVTADEPGAGR